MNDLLSETYDARDPSSREHDIEMGRRLQRNSSDMGLEAFNKQIQEVEKQIEKLSALLTKLKDANEESKSVTKAAAMKAIKKRMEKDIDEVGKIARGVKSKLEAISKDNLANRQNPGCGKGTGVDRSRTNMTNASAKKFREVMSEFQTLRQKIDDEYREVVERRVITVTGTRPDEETINQLIETGNSEQIFQMAMQDTGRGQVLSTVEEIQERHDAVREIEKKLLDLHQIYLDMAVLVEAQGDMLENIETQVSNAVDHVQSGNTALQTAKKLQKSSRKCKKCCGSCSSGNRCSPNSKEVAKEIKKMHADMYCFASPHCHYNRSLYLQTMEEVNLYLLGLPPEFVIIHFKLKSGCILSIF